MPPRPFDLLATKIAYDDDHRATRIDWPPRDQRPTTVRSLLGLWSVDDDASVHADHWERHPGGDETLVLLAGRIRLHLELDDGRSEPIMLNPGEAVVVPAGVWHRLDVVEPGRLLTFTPVAGGELRRHEPTRRGRE